MKLRRGFALAEIMVALGLVGMAIFVVLQLGNQVANLTKSSRQSGAMIELRSRTNALSRNTAAWLDKMRSAPATDGLYAGCIPDAASSVSTFNCPAVADDLLKSDSELQAIAGTQLHPVSAPIVDMMGDPLAGTLDAPLYMDNDGRACTAPNAAQTCSLKSTGFFMRTNPNVDQTPGNVRFVVKVERNSNVQNGNAPMRAQFLSVDVGTDWTQSASISSGGVGGACPTGTLKIGYLTNGAPNCVNPKKTCDSGLISLGVDAKGDPVCKTLPSCTTGGAIVDMASGNLVCSPSSPCDSGTLFLGYFSGSGKAICSSPTVACKNGQVQVGLSTTNGGTLQADCRVLPSCNDSQKLSYDGSQFVCQNATVASACSADEVVVGINTDGSAKCQAVDRSLASANLSCDSGKYVSGLQKDGSVICTDLPVVQTVAASSASSASTTSVPADSFAPNGWPTFLKCSAGGATLFPHLSSVGVNYQDGSLDGNRINYIYVAKSGANMVFTYNVSTGSFMEVINQSGLGSAPNAAAEACKHNMLHSSAACSVLVNVKSGQDTDITLTASATTLSACRLLNYTSSQGTTPGVTAQAGESKSMHVQSSPNPSQMDAYISCPSGTTKQNCSFQNGSGPFGVMNCYCW